MSDNSNKLQQVLNKDHWRYANKALVAKILSEFLYEEMLKTEITKISDDHYLHKLIISPALFYTFTAEKRIFGNWHIHGDSIHCYKNEKMTNVVMVNQFIVDTYSLIGVSGLTLGHLLRELNNTLMADCHIYSQNSPSANELIGLSNSELESCMHGHPWFVINKGRMGFSYPEYLRHAPELRNPIQLVWLAVRRSCTLFNAIDSITYDTLMQSELTQADYTRFISTLQLNGESPTEYYFMPIHIWQWENQLVTLFAESIVKKDILYLGIAEDCYLPTQSIRTFSNISHVTKLQVKLPLSIFNTAVYRGLPSDRTQLAPLLTAWLKKKYNADAYFQNECRLVLLGEIASIDFPHPFYNDLPDISYQYKELLGVIWRENVNTYLKPHESAITMAALIHVDQHKKPFITSLIEKSNLGIDAWLAKFFSVTIPPLLHWLYQYGLVFSPHGENTLLIIDEDFHPVGLVIKDFIDDVNLSDRDIPETRDLDGELKDILLKVSDHQLTQFIHTGLFVVLYRYLSNILQTYENYSEIAFWQQVNKTIKAYHHSHNELQDRIKQFDLLRISFNKMCLNRLRLLSVGYADYAERPKVDILNLMFNPANEDVIHAWGMGDIKVSN